MKSIKVLGIFMEQSHQTSINGKCVFLKTSKYLVPKYFSKI